MDTILTHVAEVTVRYASKIRFEDRPLVCTSAEASKLLWPAFAEHHEMHEAFRVLLLDRGNRVKGIYLMSTGGLHGTVVDPKLIYAVALKSLSSAIIIAHNHPSGQARPSTEDLQLTKKLVEAGKFLDLPVRDHIIIAGPDSYFSFADNAML